MEHGFGSSIGKKSELDNTLSKCMFSVGTGLEESRQRPRSSLGAILANDILNFRLAERLAVFWEFPTNEVAFQMGLKYLPLGGGNSTFTP